MKRILTPIIYNLPLFVISIFLLGGFDTAYQQYLFHENTTNGIITAFQEIIIMSYVICVCSYLLRKVYLKLFVYSILFTLYGLGCYLLYAYSAYIAPNIILLLFETNTKEATGFFMSYLTTPAMLKSIAIITFLLILTIISECQRKRISQIAMHPVISWIIYAVLLFGVLGSFGAVKRYWNLSQCKKAYDAECWRSNYLFYKVMPVPNICYSLKAISLAGQDLYYMIEATEKSISSVKPVEGDSLNIVLVIGESFNKYHAGLYGYGLDTTPFQCEEQAKGNLYAFNNVRAPHNMTSIVLKNMFCCNNVNEGERWHDYPFFPAIFKKAGYDVWLWDNQYQTNPNMAINFTLNSIIFNKRIMEMSYTDINDVCPPYDEGLVTDFEHRVKSRLGSHNLIIFHLNGQHRLYKAQYPQEKENIVFSAKDIAHLPPPKDYLDDDKRQKIAEYANATRYNDKVIKQMMDLVKGTNTIMIYFSDHGEEVYDYRDFLGRALLEKDIITPDLIKTEIEVPFIMWATDEWIERNPKEWETIGLTIDRAFTTDNICHILFRLAGIETPEYKPERDLFSPEFVQQDKALDFIGVL